MRRQLAQTLSYQSMSLPVCKYRSLSENLHLVVPQVQAGLAGEEGMMLVQFPLKFKRK